GYLMGESLFTLNAWAVPLTIFATVGVINAINMSDGVDGLAGGLTLISLVCLGIVAGLAGHQLFYLFAELIVVVLAFLIFNLRTPWRKKAKVFMGNGGSMFLGFVMAWSLINMSQGEHAVFSPVTALWLFAVPLMDTVCIMLRRVLKRRSPFSPDRQHFHHALLRVGYTVNQSVWIMLGLSAVLAGFGLIGHYGGVPESIMFFSFVVLFTVYFVAMNRVWRSLTTMGNRKRLQQPRRRIRQGGGANSASYKAAKRSKE
ncbi:MAG: undecaprenyl-phosphate alpha-N-acetylglucosaminyl 1-phosphate transferase, partial [Gammaproteobacteria bacterium]|nr:undecaprenyl-phosphate alpha-N-acetylglucosaminyl 1-phosphate transferase [Gammaproteobacteria bacterium]